MKTFIEILIILLLLTAMLYTQENDYWNAATIEGSRIYSIYFFDQQNGLAVSVNNEQFISSNGGASWKYVEKEAESLNPDTAENIWRTDVYCSVMNTIDGGKNWKPYSKEEQDHFCKVYLKDPNVEYKTASEFLEKVTRDIFTNILINKLDVPVGNPKQCTEYYCSELEGWALGWCIKNFKINRN